MPFLRTSMGTNFGEAHSRRIGAAWVDSANPGYRGKHSLIRNWLIEFDEDGAPWREIGLGENDAVVVAGPTANDYGFWLDTNMRYTDFEGEPASKEYFEKLWAASGAVAP